MKKNLVFMIVSAIVLLSVVISATYAFFVSGSIDTTNNTTINASTPNKMATFMSYSTNPLDLSIEINDMMEASTTAAKSDEGNIYVTMSSPTNNDTVYCTYSIDFVWDSTDQYTSSSMILNGTYPYELSISGSQSIMGDSTGHVYDNKNLSETNLTALTWTGNAGTVGRSARLVENAVIYSNSTTATTALWNFNLRFYSLPVAQSGLFGKTLSAHLVVSDVIC